MREYATDQVQAVVAEYVEDESRAEPERPALDEASNPLGQVTVALDRLAKQRDRWLELYVDGEVDRKQLREEQEKIRARHRNLEQEKRALQSIL
jgi:hypothetical protein